MSALPKMKCFRLPGVSIWGRSMATSVKVNNDNQEPDLTIINVKFREIIASDISVIQSLTTDVEKACELIKWAKETVSPPSGLLLPLVVKKIQNGFQLIDGHANYLALKRVHGNHVLDLEIPVSIDLEFSQISGSAQLIVDAEQAKELKLNGYTVPQISKELEISDLATNQRLALAALPSDVKNAVMTGLLQIRAASALTLVPVEHIQAWREAFADGTDWAFTEDGIKAFYSLQIVERSDAVFQLTKYTGEYFDNWFDSEPVTLFKDREQFWKLQLESLWELEQELFNRGWLAVKIITEGQKASVIRYREVLDICPFTCTRQEMEDRVAIIHIYKCGYVNFSVAELLKF